MTQWGLCPRGCCPALSEKGGFDLGVMSGELCLDTVLALFCAELLQIKFLQPQNLVTNH